MAISIRLTAKEEEIIRKYAQLNKATVSEVMRRAIMEKVSWPIGRVSGTIASEIIGF